MAGLKIALFEISRTTRQRYGFGREVTLGPRSYTLAKSYAFEAFNRVI